MSVDHLMRESEEREEKTTNKFIAHFMADNSELLCIFMRFYKKNGIYCNEVNVQAAISLSTCRRYDDA